MSWQLGALIVLGLALAGGFAWYERSRPDARVVALVATLAAFAALGRIAFAALPNVKPTTDIVLLAGYALGPAPGFVVGAAAGLASNFFFGQGPWTPWQMAAWGMTGLLGAGFGRLTGRRAGRWPLALVCLLAGFAFTVVQDLGDWVNFSDHTLTQLGLYVGKGLGFDAVHAVGCLVFALAFGPALARSLGRFTTRLQVSWKPAARAAAPLAVLAGLLGAVAAQPGAVARAAGSPASYLLSAENANGGYGPAPGQASTQLFSGWAALGLAAQGHNPARVAKNGHTLVGYLSSAPGSAGDPGAVERSILGAVAAGADPRRFGGHNLLAALERAFGRDGSVGDQTNLTAFALLALRAAGIAVPAQSLGWLLAQQDGDGGFNYATAGVASDVDDTGAVLEVLGRDPGPAATRARGRAVSFITRHQNRDGGFPASAGDTSNAQSTAWAIQGLIAAGIDPGSLHRAHAPSPLAYLDSLIAPDGHVRYSRSSDQTPVWVTAQAAMALAGRTLPLRPAPRPLPPVRRRVGRASARRQAAARTVRTLPGRYPHRPPERSDTDTRLATDAGILDALVLAPIGVG